MNRKITLRPAFLSIAAGVLLAAGAYFGGVAGCGSSSSTPTPVPTPTGSASATSGGVATINTGSSVVTFVPNGTSINVVTVESGSGSSALQLAFKDTVAPISVGFTMDSCAADGKKLRVICVGFHDSKIAVVDVSNVLDVLGGSGSFSVHTFDPGNTATLVISTGDTCLNCGVLADQDNGRYIVSSGDGYRVYDYSDAVVAGPFLSDASASPASDLGTENFGFDAATGLIISPEYESSTNLFLWAVNINTGKVYRWVHTMKGKSVDPANGLQDLDDAGITAMIADSATVDSSTGVLTIGDEFTNSLLILNMNDATFDQGALTFDAPESVLTLQNVAGSGLLTTGQSVDNVSHLLFLEDEFGPSMGIVQLPTSPVHGPISIAETDYTSANVPDPSAVCTGAFGWSNVGDPHGLSLFTSNKTGTDPKGILINGDKSCAATVDLAAFKTAESAPNTVSDASGFVTFTTIP